jgi:heme exporter protein C
LPDKTHAVAVWKWLLLPWMIAVTLLAYLWAQPLDWFREPDSARIIFWHVPMAWLGLLWFWTGAVHGLRYLFGRRRGEPALDRKSASANEIGLICTVLATVTGMVFAARQWGTPWNWDPKQVSITVLILIYLAYFGLRMSIADAELRGRLSAAYAVFGAVATPVLFWVIPQLAIVQSLHPGGTTITGGLDAKWRIIYWMAFFGFLGITLWSYQLRLRLAAVEERLSLAEGPLELEARLEARRKPALDG